MCFWTFSYKLVHLSTIITQNVISIMILLCFLANGCPALMLPGPAVQSCSYVIPTYLNLSMSPHPSFNDIPNPKIHSTLIGVLKNLYQPSVYLYPCACVRVCLALPCLAMPRWLFHCTSEIPAGVGVSMCELTHCWVDIVIFLLWMVCCNACMWSCFFFSLADSGIRNVHCWLPSLLVASASKVQHYIVSYVAWFGVYVHKSEEKMLLWLWCCLSVVTLYRNLSTDHYI